MCQVAREDGVWCSYRDLHVDTQRWLCSLVWDLEYTEPHTRMEPLAEGIGDGVRNLAVAMLSAKGNDYLAHTLAQRVIEDCHAYLASDVQDAIEAAQERNREQREADESQREALAEDHWDEGRKMTREQP